MMTLKGVSRTAIALMPLALIASSQAGAQSNAGTIKTVFENDKIAVMDNLLKPGEESASANRTGLIVYYLSGGTYERIFADGSKQTMTSKPGQSFLNPEKRPYAVTNTGKTALHVITIKLK